MSTKINDFASNANLKVSSFLTAGTTGNTAGSSCDMISSDANCFAIACVGTLNGTSPTLDFKIQESVDGSSSWTDITGATVATLSSSGTLGMVTFQRTKRYLRSYTTIAGTGSLTVPHAAFIGEQLKQL